jgi:transcriptional regulator with XRE-family HTH domain
MKINKELILMFSEKIKDILKNNNINQVQFADSIGVKKQVITEYMSGRSNPSVKVIKKIKEVYNVDLLDDGMIVEVNKDITINKEELRKEISDIIDSISDISLKLKSLEENL